MEIAFSRCQDEIVHNFYFSFCDKNQFRWKAIKVAIQCFKEGGNTHKRWKELSKVASQKVNLTVFFLCEESGTSGALQRGRLGSKALWEIREMLVRAMHSELGSLSSLTLLFSEERNKYKGRGHSFLLIQVKGKSWHSQTFVDYGNPQASSQG